MTTKLYWKVREPAASPLPILLKWAIENRGKVPPTKDWLEGFMVALPDNAVEPKEQIAALLRALEEGKEIEYEWR